MWSVVFTNSPETFWEGYSLHLEGAVGRKGDFDAQQRVEPTTLFGCERVEGTGRYFGVGLQQGVPVSFRLGYLLLVVPQCFQFPLSCLTCLFQVGKFATQLVDRD